MAALLEDLEEFACDRRKSRAAVVLVQRLLGGAATAEEIIWQQQQVMKKDHPSSTCLLHPSRNPFRKGHEESLYHRVPASSAASKLYSHPRRASSSSPHWWFQCAHCGKTFVTQYYMDVHLERHHHPSLSLSLSSNTTTSTTMICPARDYCEAFYGCDHVALELEPHYGRGSGGVGPDAVHVRQEWSRRIPPCNETYLKEQVQPKCRQVMLDCFGTGGGGEESLKHQQHYLDICNAMTCHHYLHWPSLPERMMSLSRQSWEEVWRHHHSRTVSVGVTGGIIVLITALVVVFGYHAKQPRMSPKQHRLLSKKQINNKRTTGTTLWKRIVSPKQKQKMH